MTTGLVAAGASLSLLGLLSAGCTSAPGPVAEVRKPNVLLVTIDTLRADRLGCYGHASAETPVLDGLAARGVRFATAVAHVPLTGPSHASILTGLGPLRHGFRDNGGFQMPADVATAAELFAKARYRTAAFVSAFTVERRFGFDRGFDTYDDRLAKGTDPHRTPYVERKADATTEAALRWLETGRSDASVPFFLWVHYYDPHAPYEPPGELAARFRKDPYDGEIAFVDRELGRLLQGLDGAGETQRSVVVALADHGESLGEHGEGTHGLFVYDATLRVPWIMAGPGIQAGRVSPAVARGIDALPTLLDYAGLSVPAQIEGRSLRAAAEGRTMSDAPAYAESLYPQREFGWAALFAWRTAGFKLIEAPRPELYDLGADPDEKVNRATVDVRRADGLRRSLQAALAQQTPGVGSPVDPEAAQRLAALGYVGGGAAASRDTKRLRDPKDGARVLRRLNRGMAAVRADPALAIGELKTVLAEDPGLLMARRSLAMAYAAAGRHEPAIAELRRLEKEGHLSAADAVALGDNLRFAGRLQEAALVLERTTGAHPRFAQPWLSLAAVRIGQQRLAEAAAAYERVLAAVPDHVEALRGLGDLALLQDQVEAAGRRYERVLQLEPEDAGARAKLGVVRLRSGRAEGAVSLLRQALAREPENGETLLYMATALSVAGRPAEAVPYYEHALRAGHRSATTLNGLGLTRLRSGDREGAARAFRESLRLDPRQPDVTRALAEIARGGSP